MGKKHILFNFASRSRPARFADVCLRIQRYCTHPYTILAKIDDDDLMLNAYLNSGLEVQFVHGLSGSKIVAINKGIQRDGWDILVNVSDDIIFTKVGFDDIIREHCGPDDFLLFPEPYADGQVVKGKNERIAVMSVMGRDYYMRDGYVYNPAYKSLWCDNEATTVARIRGRLKEIEESIFYHAHPVAGHGKKDAQYINTESFYRADEKVFLSRKAAGFP